mgnify:CR=1 FL=1
MIGSKRSLLFFEDRIDLAHLKHELDKYELDSSFRNNSESFIEACKIKKFDLLIISGVGSDLDNLALIDSLYPSVNSDTPILFIVENSSVPPPEELLNYMVSIIVFPFTPEEFVFRVIKILRSVETEKNIDKNLKSYKKLFDILPMGIVLTDEHGKFKMVNPGFYSILRITEKDLINENFFQLCHPDDYFVERKQLDRLLRKEVNSVDYEIRLINDDGKTFVCSVQATIIWSRQGVFESFVYVLREIS